MKWFYDSEYVVSSRYEWYDEVLSIAGKGKSCGFDTFTELLVRNAGHLVPYDQKKWAYIMYKTFIDGDSFNNI